MRWEGPRPPKAFGCRPDHPRWAIVTFGKHAFHGVLNQVTPCNPTLLHATHAPCGASGQEKDVLAASRPAKVLILIAHLHECLRGYMALKSQRGQKTLNNVHQLAMPIPTTSIEVTTGAPKMMLLDHQNQCWLVVLKVPKALEGVICKDGGAMC